MATRSGPPRFGAREYGGQSGGSSYAGVRASPVPAIPITWAAPDPGRATRTEAEGAPHVAHSHRIHDSDSVGHGLVPTSARHGVDRGQSDPSAAVIRLLRTPGWVYEARRPTPTRVAARRA
ncbi:hypothetical protein GCM10017744_091000 [Streptomyces antimycoticus]|uniref:Uncharacterized protein n=1 Tax=Streptomyces antimycoticus TaxID=68175 RepID=A0A4D4JZI5_9ACTN|nr:hypothetical protein SANT12839_002990 [Streptomyces antimycoticus]